MPQLPALDEFPYVPQEEDSLACVPACLEMICDYLGLLKDRAEIEEEVGYSIDAGTPFQNVYLLSGVRAVLVSSFWEAAQQIERGLPVIADLRIEDDAVLGYAGEGAFDHAVVVGVEPGEVLFFDPLSWDRQGTGGPTACDDVAFERSWLSGWVLVPYVAG